MIEVLHRLPVVVDELEGNRSYRWLADDSRPSESFVSETLLRHAVKRKGTTRNLIVGFYLASPPLAAGDRIAREAFAAAGSSLDLFPPLIRGVILVQSRQE